MILYTVYYSVADPTFHADADPNFFARLRTKCFIKIFNYCFQNIKQLVMCNFLSKNAGGGVRCEE